MTPPAVVTPAAPAAPVAPAIIAGASAEQIQAAKEAEARLQQLLAMGDINQANAVTALYGDSGTGKSTLCATAAEYCWTRYRRITEYIAADLGGFGNKLLRLIRLGIVRVYNPQNHIEPFETMEDLSLGYWPETVLDRFTGYAAPDVRLLPAQRQEWQVFCPNNHLVTTLTNKASLQGFSLQCKECKAVVNPTNWNRVEERLIRSAHHQHVGLRIFDSATALEDWGMAEMGNRAAKQMDTVGASDDKNALTKTGGRLVSGKYAFGANSLPHYGFVQNRMPQWIRNARGIPGMVMPPIFTFLEQRAMDDSGRGQVAVFAPKIAGSAKGPDVPAWVGNCLHISRELNDKGMMEHRIWTLNHIDQGGNIPHLAKTRAEPGTLPAYIADKDGEEKFTRFSLGYFFDQLDQAMSVGAQQDAVDFPDAPVFQPLPDLAEEVLSSRAISSGTLPLGAGRPSGAPTAVRPAMAAQPAVLARPGAPTLAAQPAAATVAPAAVAQPKPAVAAPAVAQPAVAKPVVAAQPAVAQQPKPAAPATPVAPAVAAAPQSAAAPVQAPAPSAAAPAAAAPAAPAAPVQRPPQPSAVRTPARPPATPPPPPGRPQPK